MDPRTWREIVLYRRRIHHFREKHFSTHSDHITLASIIDLTIIIPETLIGDAKIKHTELVTLNNNFNNVIHYLDWLDSIADVIVNKEFFTIKQTNALSNHREISLENFLTDDSGMYYYPHVILSNINNKIAKIQRLLFNSELDQDMYDYYSRRLKGYMTMISQPVFAIGELAGINDE